MISLTEMAAKTLLKFFEEKDPKPIGIRVGVQGGGCSGFTYKLEYAHEVSEGDREIESNGVKIIIDRKSLLYFCLLYTSPSPRDATLSRMPSSA